MDKKTCCFFGHRNIIETEELKSRLSEIIENLIVNQNVCTFLFGSKSCFDSLCLNLVTKAKEKYPYIERIYVRAEFPYIDNNYLTYLLKSYDKTYFPQNIINAGRAVYVERNYQMIEQSNFCVVYYDKALIPPNRKSGTEIALSYAQKKNLPIILL